MFFINYELYELSELFKARQKSSYSLAFLEDASLISTRSEIFRILRCLPLTLTTFAGRKLIQAALKVLLPLTFTPL